jgi:hypothetical protein
MTLCQADSENAQDSLITCAFLESGNLMTNVLSSKIRCQPYDNLAELRVSHAAR